MIVDLLLKCTGLKCQNMVLAIYNYMIYSIQARSSYTIESMIMHNLTDTLHFLIIHGDF